MGRARSAAVGAFADAGATVAACDVVDPDDEGLLLAPDAHEGVSVYRADSTDESAVRDTVEAMASDHGGLDYLLDVAGTWRGGDPVDGTDADQFDLLFGVNLLTALLANKHALRTSAGARPGAPSSPCRRARGGRAATRSTA